MAVERTRCPTPRLTEQQALFSGLIVLLLSHERETGDNKNTENTMVLASFSSFQSWSPVCISDSTDAFFTSF